MTAAPAKPELLRIPLEAITAHPANRKRFDPGQLAELADSLRTHGQLTPALVRPTGEGYELLAGERRFRATKLAGLPTLLCLVRDLTDADALEILAIENNQREDVHPLEEADLYKALLAVDGYDVARIAGRLHRSVAYVYDRLKLLQLGKPARQLFLDGVIGLGHAAILGRYSQEVQEQAIGAAKLRYSDGGLLQEDFTLFAPGTEDPNAFRYKAKSVGELQAWIDRHVRFEVDKVKQEELLHDYPETAQALTEAQQAALQILPITYEYSLRDEARAEDGSRTWGPMSWRRADGKRGSKTCAHNTHLGVIAAGPGRGESFRVCTAKKECRVHWGPEIREAARRAKERAELAAAPTGKAAKAPQKMESYQEREARAKAQRAEWAKDRLAVLEALEKKGIPPLGRLLPRLVAQVLRDTSAVATELLEEKLDIKLRWGGSPDKTAPTIAALSSDDQDRAAFYVLLADDLEPYSSPKESDHLFQLATAAGLNPSAIMAARQAAAKAESKAKAKPAPKATPVKTPADKGKDAPAAKVKGKKAAGWATPGAMAAAGEDSWADTSWMDPTPADVAAVKAKKKGGRRGTPA